MASCACVIWHVEMALICYTLRSEAAPVMSSSWLQVHRVWLLKFVAMTHSSIPCQHHKRLVKCAGSFELQINVWFAHARTVETVDNKIVIGYLPTLNRVTRVGYIHLQSCWGGTRSFFLSWTGWAWYVGRLKIFARHKCSHQHDAKTVWLVPNVCQNFTASF